MVSPRRRGSKRLPAVVAGLAVLGVCAYFFWPQAGSSEAAISPGEQDRDNRAGGLGTEGCLLYTSDAADE